MLKQTTKNRIKPIVPYKVVELLDKLEKEKIKYNKLVSQVEKAKEQIKITCTSDVYGKGCGHQQRIGDTIYIQTEYREYNCGVGYQWYNGEGQFKCNKCGKLVRLYDCEEITKLQNNFKDVEYKEHNN